MFRFNFEIKDSEGIDDAEGRLEDSDGDREKKGPPEEGDLVNADNDTTKAVQTRVCEKIEVKNHQNETEDELEPETLILEDGTCIYYVDSQLVENTITNKQLSQSEDSKTQSEDNASQPKLKSDVAVAARLHSDLIPNVYEGGLKVWECSIDLTQYLATQKLNYDGLRVLELGCGAGIPGLYAYSKGAKVDFQDYNEEVLNLITIPNVFLNTAAEAHGNVAKRCGFYSGDWPQNVKTVLLQENKRYDLILTSETIYNTESQKKLYDLIKTVLADSGDVYVAAKTHYFGVGGGTAQFMELVKQDKVLDIKCCKTIEEGLQREILHMRAAQSR